MDLMFKNISFISVVNLLGNGVEKYGKQAQNIWKKKFEIKL